MTSGGNNFNEFAENQLTTFRDLAPMDATPLLWALSLADLSHDLPLLWRSHRVNWRLELTVLGELVWSCVDKSVNQSLICVSVVIRENPRILRIPRKLIPMLSRLPLFIPSVTLVVFFAMYIFR